MRVPLQMNLVYAVVVAADGSVDAGSTFAEHSNESARRDLMHKLSLFSCSQELYSTGPVVSAAVVGYF